MKKLILFCIIFFSALTNSFASDTIVLKKETTKPDKVDKVLLTNTVKLLVDDWGQTRDIANHHNREETNSILGKKPSNDRVDAYFAACVSASVIAAAEIENPSVRKTVLAAIMILEAYVIYNNSKLGLHNEFSDERRPIMVSMTFPF